MGGNCHQFTLGVMSNIVALFLNLGFDFSSFFFCFFFLLVIEGDKYLIPLGQVNLALNSFFEKKTKIRLSEPKSNSRFDWNYAIMYGYSHFDYPSLISPGVS